MHRVTWSPGGGGGRGGRGRGGATGPTTGTFTVTMTVDGQSYRQTVTLKADPRAK
jgi:hypothetical protein